MSKRNNGGYTIEIPRKRARNILKLKQAMGEAQKDRRMESKKVKFSQSSKEWEDEDWGEDAPVNSNKVYVLIDRNNHETIFMESDLAVNLIKDIIRIKDDEDLICICDVNEWDAGNKLSMLFFEYLEWSSFLTYQYENDQYKRNRHKDPILKALPYNTLKQLVSFWRGNINKPSYPNKLVDSIMSCFDEIELEYKDKINV